MKNKLSIIGLVFFSILSFAQTKVETENWIKSFISTYSNGSINFQNGLLIHEDPWDPMGLHVKASVQIKDLAGVKISEGTKGHSAIYLSCAEGQCVQDGIKARNESKFENFLNNKLSMQMNSILSDDLQRRAEKAFNHLIKLYGGLSLSDTF